MRAAGWLAAGGAGAAFALLLALPAPTHGAGGFLDGPPPGYTGGFGEPNCTGCHFGSDVNAAGGSLQVTGLPRRPEPGREYRLMVTLRRQGMQAAGFQLTVRDSSGRQAGTLS